MSGADGGQDEAPRPADAVRRALRDARRAGNPPETDRDTAGAGTPGVTAGPQTPGVTTGPASAGVSGSALAAGQAEERADESRPGDVAREALRAARAARRAAQDPDSHSDVPAGMSAEEDVRAPAGPAGTSEGAPRPGDMARDALRSGRAAGGAAQGPDALPAEPTDGDARGPGTGAHVPADGGRPGDVARKALRSARGAEGAADPDTSADAHAEGDVPGRDARVDASADGGRPGDVAREALRSARAATAAPEGRDAGQRAAEGDRRAAGDGDPPPRAGRAQGSAPAPRPGDPGRADIHHRTAATAPAHPRDGGGTRPFATTWWGRAWVAALEDGAVDAARLARGRAYAEEGHVGTVRVTPGEVLAYVQGSRPRPYRVRLEVRRWSPDAWERFLDAAAAAPGRIAALLEKELPQSAAEDGALLPGPGELRTECGCPDAGRPCKHAAALCYATARLLDEDPFLLLLLRGRGEHDVLDALAQRNAARAAASALPAPLPGLRARDAVRPRALPPLPAPLPPPPHPEQPPACPAVPGGPDPFALDQLATGAAARAHTLLTRGRDPLAGLTLWQDAVRLAAAHPGSGLTAATRALYASLAEATGRTAADLARAVAAWRQGGEAALTVLEEPWDPPAGRFDRARPALLAADFPPFRPRHNQLTHPDGHLQLRLGRDGLWYAYESEPGHDDWWPRGTPDLDPVGALTGLGLGSGSGERGGTPARD
ncbi:SWIM zinc finger family protein [Streptomyces sp. NPDC002004]